MYNVLVRQLPRYYYPQRIISTAGHALKILQNIWLTLVLVTILTSIIFHLSNSSCFLKNLNSLVIMCLHKLFCP